MLRTTIWRDLRWRLVAALLLVVPPAVLVAGAYGLEPQRSRAEAAGLDYLGYLDAAWFWVPGASAVLLPAAVLLGAGGVLVRPRADLAFLFALPVPRQRWIFLELLAALAALAALVCATGLIFAAGAWWTGEPLAFGALFGRSLAVLLAAAPWMGVASGVLAAVRRPALAAALVLGAVVALPSTLFVLDLPVRPRPALLPSWEPWVIADPRAWQSGPPLTPLLIAAAMAVAGTLLAWRRIERLEP